VEARFSARPDRPWGPPSLLYNGYRVFPGGKMRPEPAADLSPPSSAEVFEELSYTSSTLWVKTGPVTALLYFYFSYWEDSLKTAKNDLSKHVADLATSGVYTFWCMWSWFYKLTIRLVHEDQLQTPLDIHKGCIPRSFNPYPANVENRVSSQ
jgi:hypothetical protein